MTDRSWVHDMAAGGRRAEAIVRSIVELAHTLELAVVVEGIETPEALERLCELDCDYGQGDLLGRPAPSDEAASALAGRAVVLASAGA